MIMHISPAVPILRIFDEGKAKDFYLGFLGFTLDWEHRFEPGTPLYAQITRSACIIHLSEHHGDAAPGSAVRIAVDDIDGYHAEIMEKGYKYMRPGIEAMPWGTREIKVIDPFFNRLMFFSPAKKD
ncbi:glyoxalase superfamily protein [Hyphomicrobium sp. MC8b]|uniref:glyoxalase superfamily protein n=2 Tax=unclassified Hyphomicrobium TaxID=2619925 RepID=UPI00391B528D